MSASVSGARLQRFCGSRGVAGDQMHFIGSFDDLKSERAKELGQTRVLLLEDRGPVRALRLRLDDRDGARRRFRRDRSVNRPCDGEERVDWRAVGRFAIRRDDEEASREEVRTGCDERARHVLRSVSSHFTRGEVAQVSACLRS